MNVSAHVCVNSEVLLLKYYILKWNINIFNYNKDAVQVASLFFPAKNVFIYFAPNLECFQTL